LYGQEQMDTLAILQGKFTIEKKEGIALLPEVKKAYLAMKKAAKVEGIELRLVSGFRSYHAQRGIWNRKYTAYTKAGLSPEESIQKIIKYSTLPGTSRHHWGTDVDLIDAVPKVAGDVLLSNNFEKGAYRKLHAWLQAHAAKYGFTMVYTNDPNRKGFEYEPWHYSYAPLAIPFLKKYVKDKLIEKIQKDPKLLGNSFLTENFLKSYFESHVLGVKKELKPTL
jgi:LAS superfamily LD-carboxypeptidase LdcB